MFIKRRTQEKGDKGKYQDCATLGLEHNYQQDLQKHKKEKLSKHARTTKADNNPNDKNTRH